MRSGFNSSGSGISLGVEGRLESDLGLALQGRLDEVMEARAASLAQAYTRAMDRGVTKPGKAKLRADIIQGGFENAVKLSKTWRATTYPKSAKGSLEPTAYFVNRAQVIIDAFEQGATIRPNGASFLAIPVGEAKAIVRKLNRQVAGGKDGFGRNFFGRFTQLGNPVERVAAALGVTLVAIVAPDGKTGVLVADNGLRVTKTGRISKRQTGEATVLFVLVREAHLSKRIQGRAVLDEMLRNFEGGFAAALMQELPQELRE